MLLRTDYKMKPPISVRLKAGCRIAKDIRLSYLFNERSGVKAFDSTGYQNHGDKLGGVTSVAGKYGTALKFDGVDGRVVVPYNHRINLNCGMTFHLLVKFDALFADQEQYARVFARNHNYRLFCFNNGMMRFEVYDTGDASHFVNFAFTDWDTETWYALSMTYDCATFRTYLNGAIDNSKADAFDIFTTETSGLNIAARDAATYQLAGTIEHFNAWERALDHKEIVSNVVRPFRMFEQRGKYPGRVSSIIAE